MSTRQEFIETVSDGALIATSDDDLLPARSNSVKRDEEEREIEKLLDISTETVRKNAILHWRN